MIETPENENGMFFVGMNFSPTEYMTQDDLERLTVHILRRLFVSEDGEMIQVKHEKKSTMMCLAQFLLDLKPQLTEAAFEDIPDDLKKFFMVQYRDGTEHRYGARPSW